MNNIKIFIETTKDDLIFRSNKEFEGDTLWYSLKEVKEIFSLNPLPTIEVKDNNLSSKIYFDIEYDIEENLFYMSMFMKEEKIDSKIISLIDMLEMLVDLYTKNIFINSHSTLTSRMYNMLNKYSHTLLKENKIPNMILTLQGIGEIIHNKNVVALFDRIAIDHQKGEILLHEVVGDIPKNDKFKINIKTDIGVTLEIDDLFVDLPNDYATLMDIQYVLAYASKENITDKMKISQNEEFDFKQNIQTLNLCEVFFTTMQHTINLNICQLNQNSSESLIDFVRNRKDILFKEEEESYLLNQVDDLFEDLI
jgi:hypothetical protein